MTRGSGDPGQRGVHEPNETGDLSNGDPFAMFDALITEGMEGKYEEAKNTKELDDAAVEQTQVHTDSFKELSTSGTYDQLILANFQMYIPSAAMELGIEVPGNFEDGLAVVNKTEAAIKKFDNLPSDLQADPRYGNAIDQMKQKAEEVMRGWAKELHGQFIEINERYQADADTADQSLQEIINSPVFRADVRMGNETVDQFSDRVQEVLVDRYVDKGKDHLDRSYGIDQRYLIGDQGKESKRVRNESKANVLEGIRAFGEEKFAEMVAVINEHVGDNEEEKRKALNLILNADLSLGVAYHQNTATVFSHTIVDIKGEMPSWLIPVLKIHNDAELFSRLVIPSHKDGWGNGFGHVKDVRKILTSTEVLNALDTGHLYQGGQEIDFDSSVETGERGFDIKIKEKGDDFESGRFDHDIGDDLQIKAFATRQMLDPKGGNTNNNGWGCVTPDSRIVKNIGGKLLLQDSFDRTPVDNWKEEIAARIQARKPTTSEKMNAELERNGGLEITTVVEAQRYVDLLKGEVKKAAIAIERVKTEAQGTEEEQQGLIGELTNDISSLNAEKNRVMRELEELKGKADRSDKEIKRLIENSGANYRELTAQAEKEKRRADLAEAELVKLRNTGTATRGQIQAGLNGVDKITGWGADKKKADALKALLEELQAQL